MIPPNEVTPTKKQDEVVITPPRKRARRKRVRPDISYKDLSASVNVHVPSQNIIVSLPSSRAGLAAKMYVPSMMLHNIIEARIAHEYAVLKDGTSAPTTVKHLKDLMTLLNESNTTLEKAWNMSEFGTHKKQKPEGEGLANVFKGTVNIQSAIFGKDPDKINLDDALSKLNDIKAQAIDAQEVMDKEAKAEAGLDEDEER